MHISGKLFVGGNEIGQVTELTMTVDGSEWPVAWLFGDIESGLLPMWPLEDQKSELDVMDITRQMLR